MTTSTSRDERAAKLAELIDDIRVAMLTTAAPDGSLRSRPMATQRGDSGEELWFFTRASSAKVEEVRDDARVNVSYASAEDQRYVSVSGTATLVRDRKKAEELWSPWHKAWFPQGLADPDLALLKVRVEQAEYWDGPSSKMVQLFGIAKAVITGTTYEPGEHEKLDFAPKGAK